MQGSVFGAPCQADLDDPAHHPRTVLGHAAPHDVQALGRVLPLADVERAADRTQNQEAIQPQPVVGCVRLSALVRRNQLCWLELRNRTLTQQSPNICRNHLITPYSRFPERQSAHTMQQANERFALTQIALVYELDYRIT